jgi:hypothetical protein
LQTVIRTLLPSASTILALFLAHGLAVAATDGPLARPETSANALADLKAWLAKPAADRPPLTNAPFARVPLTRGDASAATAALWQDHAEFIRQTRADEMAAKVLELDGLQMKFEMLVFTNSPATNGSSLFLSLHGGGGAPARVNDSQYRNQIQLGKGYRPSEGIYLAPRAPTDAWNLWHQAHIDTFFARLIENLIVLSNVNPNRVYVLGYSAGGDGVYQLVPRTADRWAAAAMMAGHPNEASPLGLRNVPFAIQVGANDGGFNRNKVAADWGKRLDALQAEDPQGYVHFTELHAGKGHWMDLEDRKAIPWMEKFTRVPLPERVVWFQDDATHDRCYWLEVPPGQPKAGQEIIAQRQGQAVTISGKGAPKATVLLNDAMLNLDEPVAVRAGDQALFEGRRPRTIATLARTLGERGDTNLTFSAEATVTLP